MKKRKTLLLAPFVTMIVMLFAHTEVGAVANGNGICEDVELENRDCARFNKNIVLEFLGTTNSFCTRHEKTSETDGTGESCTQYTYQMSMEDAHAENSSYIPHLSLFIPEQLVAGLDPEVIGCRQLSEKKTIPTLKRCQVDLAFASFGKFDIFVRPSLAEPASWQLKKGDRKLATVVNGPGDPAPAVVETEVTLRSGNTSITYEDGNPPRIVKGNARVIPINQTKLCILNDGGDRVPFTDPAFKDNYVCEDITSVTEQCDVKTSGSDPCRYIAGFCLQF